MGCIGWWGEGGSLGRAVRPDWTISRRWSWTEDVVGRRTFHSIFIPSPSLYTLFHDPMLCFTIFLISR